MYPMIMHSFVQRISSHVLGFHVSAALYIQISKGISVYRSIFSMQFLDGVDCRNYFQFPKLIITRVSGLFYYSTCCLRIPNVYTPYPFLYSCYKTLLSRNQHQIIFSFVLSQFQIKLFGVEVKFFVQRTVCTIFVTTDSQTFFDLRNLFYVRLLQNVLFVFYY